MAFEKLADARRDAAQVVRLLRVRPGFGLVLVLTLALGIGAPTAVFSVIYAVLLRPLPYPEADRLVRFGIEARSPRGTVAFDALPATTALRWGADSATLGAMALYNDRALTLTTPDGPERLTGVAATPNLFAALGVAPAIGRTFEASDRDGRLIVLSHETWRRLFAARADIAGATVMLDGEPFRVTGVMPERFGFPSPETAFWTPLLIAAEGSRGMLLPAVARLRPDASVASVLEEGRRWLSEDRGPREEQTLIVRTLHEQMVGHVERSLWVLLTAVGLVAVIATANMALLLLVRGAGRMQEFSIRLALGARRGQLVRQLFAEAATLSFIGGAAGLLLATGLLRILLSQAPPEIPRLQEVALNGPVLAFALAVTIGASLAFVLLSVGRTIAVDPARALGGSAADPRLVGLRSTRRRMNLLAAAELALTMVLLAGAGLLLRSFVGLVLVDQGFTGRGSVALRFSLPVGRYPGVQARLAFHERLLERLRGVEGAESLGLTTSMPNRQPSGRFAFDPTANPVVEDPFTLKIAEVRMATEGFIEAMGVPVLAGRTFRATDGSGAEDVIVISEQLARVHFPNQDAVGRVLYSGAAGTVRVIGVVGNVRPASGGDPVPAAYLPLRQDPGVLQWTASMNLVARGGQPLALARAVRSAISSLDPDVPVFSIRTLDQEVSTLVAGPRFVASVLGAFALVALAMAAVGVYGVMSYSAAQRTREIGVRVALGATRGQVVRLMLRDGMLVVGAGLIAGLVAALWIGRTLTGLLHDVDAADPLALAGVGAILAAVGLLAAYLPARRATRINALDALRSV